MATKTGTWLIRIGACIAFLGLFGLLAAFEPIRDKTLLGAGMMVLSAGMMLVAGGLYIKARTFPATVASNASHSKRGRKTNCDRCGKNEPVIQCRVHQVHLCGDCLGNHYDFRSCAYVPSTRRSTTKTFAAAKASGT